MIKLVCSECPGLDLVPTGKSRRKALSIRHEYEHKCTKCNTKYWLLKHLKQRRM